MIFIIPKTAKEELRKRNINEKQFEARDNKSANLSICFKQKLEQSDYTHFAYSNSYGSFTGKLDTIIGIIVLYSLSSTISSIKGSGQEISFVSFLPSMVFLCFLFLAPLPLYFRHKIAMISNKTLQKEQSFEISKDGIKIEIDSSILVIKWNEVFSIKEFSQGFSIFVSSNIAYIISKRFLTKDEIALLKDFFRESVNPKKVKLKKS